MSGGLHLACMAIGILLGILSPIDWWSLQYMIHSEVYLLNKVEKLYPLWIYQCLCYSKLIHTMPRFVLEFPVMRLDEVLTEVTVLLTSGGKPQPSQA
ncbi:hypothetical protein HAX54_052349 [Datura stramonium]|uniref:Uncharacterized protein n=1 Tax=Datura stramonium TaxID=4076 RepID=A0ABS8WNC4_DATST|nr:hypothetical protein [Datura stramonium]